MRKGSVVKSVSTKGNPPETGNWVAAPKRSATKTDAQNIVAFMKMKIEQDGGVSPMLQRAGIITSSGKLSKNYK